MAGDRVSATTVINSPARRSSPSWPIREGIRITTLADVGVDNAAFLHAVHELAQSARP